MSTRISRWLLAVFAVAMAGAVFIGEDAREPGGPLSVDRHVLRFAVEHRTAMWDDVALIVSHLGDPVTLAVLALAATVLIWGRRRSIIEAAVPITSLVVAAAIEFITKRIIGRPRPPALYHLLQETDPSFPSGHATGSAAFFVALALVVSPRLRSTLARIALVVASATLAALIGIARVVLGVHWVTDIAAGWLIGVAVAAGVVLVARRWLHPLSPASRWVATLTGDEQPAPGGPRQVGDDAPVRSPDATDLRLSAHL